MDDKQKKQDSEAVRKTADIHKKKDVRKVHGARMSKFNPELEAEIQFQAHKLRIFKLFMSMVIIFALVVAAAGLLNYFQKRGERKAWIDARIQALDKLEKDFERVDLSPYQKEQKAAKAYRDAERLAERYPEVRETVNKKLALYSKILRDSFPVVTAPGKKGMNFICQSGMLDMIHIPNGSFSMGRSNKPQDGKAMNEVPRREINIAEQFWMARTEVDIWQIRKIIPSFKMKEWGEYKLDNPDQPAGGVRWDQAVLYCKKLTELERNAGRIPDGYEYRLPTEAEWEYACRAGTDTVYYWGDDFGNEGAKYANGLDAVSAKKFDWKLIARDNAAKNDKFFVSAPVGSLRPNAWGLYDMLGNVAEWCYDWYAPNIYHDKKVLSSPLQNTPVSVVYTQYRPFDDGTWDTEIPCKVIRGGSWGVVPMKMRSASRDFMPPNEVNNGIGFRPVLAPAIKNRLRN